MKRINRTNGIIRKAAVLAVAALAVTGCSTGDATAAEPTPATTTIGDDSALLTEIEGFSRSTNWQTTAGPTFSFDTFHPQGMMVLGDRVFVSSVEIIEPTTKYPTPQDGYDRSVGKGKGHLFVTDLDGNLLEDIEIGKGDEYHPSAFGYDGERLWVASTEYRPHSATTMYTVDVDTYDVQEKFAIADSIGGVVWDASRSIVVGVNWGSRVFYEWDENGKELATWNNPGDFIDYQGCQYVADGQALCTGIATVPGMPGSPEGAKYEIGGLALVDLVERRIVKETPLQQFSEGRHVLTRNPAFAHMVDGRFELVTAPDDGEGIKMYRTVVGD